jgi:hypothetical protein
MREYNLVDDERFWNWLKNILDSNTAMIILFIIIALFVLLFFLYFGVSMYYCVAKNLCYWK